MYDFHYNHVKAKYGDRAEMLFTDTDSLAYEIKRTFTKTSQVMQQVSLIRATSLRIIPQV